MWPTWLGFECGPAPKKRTSPGSTRVAGIRFALVTSPLIW